MYVFLTIKYLVNNLPNLHNNPGSVGRDIERSGLSNELMEVINKFSIPFISLPFDKGTLSEQHSLFLGTGLGNAVDEELRQFIKKADYVLIIGSNFRDLNAFSLKDQITTSDITYAYDNILKHDGKKIAEAVTIGDVIKIIKNLSISPFSFEPSCFI